MKNQEKNVEREKLSAVFHDHPLYRLTTGACRAYEQNLIETGICVEELFIQTANCIDKVKENDDDPSLLNEVCEGMWDATWSDLSRKTESINKEELDLATCVVQTLLMLCLILSPRHSYLVGILMVKAEEKFASKRPEVLNKLTIYQARFLKDSLESWVTEFMSVDNFSYLSEEIESAFNDEEEVEEDSSDGKIAPLRVRHLVLNEILKKCSLGTDIHDNTKVCRLVAFILGTSEKNALKNFNNGLDLNERTHGMYVEKVNKLLSDLASDIKINC